MTDLQRIMPDIIARVRLFSTEAGGRRSAIPATRFRCPAFFGEQRQNANDCVLLLDQIGAGLEPGGVSRDVPIKFAARDLVADKLRPGARFVLWDGRDIGEAEVLEVRASKQ